MTHKLLLGTAWLALAAAATPALAQDDPPPAAPPAAESDSDAPITVTARRREESLRRRAALDHRLFGRRARGRRRARHHRHRRHHAQRHPGGLARHQLDAHRLHPRRRPAGSGRRLRGGRRHLCRRRLSQSPAGRPPRHLRRRADRGAARAAGHALRPQHDRRRDQICDPAARPRRRRSGSAPRSAPTSRPIWCVSASAPIAEDGTVRLGGSIARLSRGGFGENLTTGLDNYNKDIWAGRVSLEINNDDNLFIRVQGDYTADNSRPARRPPADPGHRQRHAGARRRVRQPRRAARSRSRV